MIELTQTRIPGNMTVHNCMNATTPLGKKGNLRYATQLEANSRIQKNRIIKSKDLLVKIILQIITLLDI